MLHTDSNQHVNSLVYPRLFEEAVVRALTDRAGVPDPGSLLARSIELRYRKPFFTGERAAIAIHAEPVSGGPRRGAAVGTFAPAAGAPKPSCTIATWLG
jgi:acyl-CoA thioesterase FadM